jgi:hypothetical protein
MVCKQPQVSAAQRCSAAHREKAACGPFLASCFLALLASRRTLGTSAATVYVAALGRGAPLQSRRDGRPSSRFGRKVPRGSSVAAQQRRSGITPLCHSARPWRVAGVSLSRAERLWQMKKEAAAASEKEASTASGAEDAGEGQDAAQGGETMEA